VDARDTQLYRDFVGARSDALLRTAYLLVGDRGRAEDLLQTALMKTYQSWGRIKDKGALESYVRRTMVTTATSWSRRHWRAERPTELLPETTETAELGDLAVGQADRDELWRLLQRLPVKQRAVLVLRFYQDMSEAQVAETLGIARGTVKSHTSRALAVLRDHLRTPARIEGGQR
jgi:RNA polymerase sigma-70 factor (sigma-E family)